MADLRAAECTAKLVRIVGRSTISQDGFRGAFVDQRTPAVLDGDAYNPTTITIATIDIAGCLVASARSSSAALSRAALKVLAVLAYRQPIARAGIELMRGSASEDALDSLLQRGLVAHNTHHLLSTTRDFLQYAGLRDIADLPSLAGIDGGELGHERDVVGRMILAGA